MTQWNSKFYDFVRKFSHADTFKLRLSTKKDLYEFDVENAILQIECRKKYASKLKNYLKHSEFIFPDAISGEQASHRAVAKFHSSLVKPEAKILDITAGLGIDSLSFAEKGNEVTAIELSETKAVALTHNSEILNLDNLKVINADSIEFLKNTDCHYNIIFADPARRDNCNKRVYNLHDCLPDIIENQQLLAEKADRILIKTSPLLDITQTLRDLNNIKRIYAVGVKGECKELLVEIENVKENDTQNSIETIAVNLDNEGEILSLYKDIASSPSVEKEERNEISFASLEDLKPDVYILEPSAIVMKIAPWEAICRDFKAKKAGKSSHIFISEKFPENFPGRVTKFQKLLTKQDRKSLSGFPATVISRNYPLTADELRKKLRINEGDKNFIYATRIGEKPLVWLSQNL